ncbi:MAG: DUF922 domain-containing protein [Myxococcota bacterium]
MLFLLLACAHAPPGPAEAPPALERAEVHWFDLEGRDRIELLESCLRDCPRDEQGVAVASLTTWQLRWGWQRAPVEPCAVASTSVDAMVSVALPRWDPPADADPALVVEWEAWHTRLRRHEQGHVDVVHAFAHDAEARIAAAGCAGVDAAGAALMAGLRQAQADYDTATASGHRQGASFWGVSVGVSGIDP